jgi:hypothetical protein
LPQPEEPSYAIVVGGCRFRQRLALAIRLVSTINALEVEKRMRHLKHTTGSVRHSRFNRSGKQMTDARMRTFQKRVIQNLSVTKSFETHAEQPFRFFRTFDPIMFSNQHKKNVPKKLLSGKLHIPEQLFGPP